MLRKFSISLPALFITVSLLVAGELATGTSPYFAAMMAVAMLSIGITYNLLGGLATFSGWLFTAFALHTIVISQFAKVLLFESADKNLESPELTISIYAVFYLSLMVGVSLFGKVRLRLPKPMENYTDAQSKLLYTVALLVGGVSTVVFESYSMAYGLQTEYTGERNAALAFMPLLLFSLVVAVDGRIRRSAGKHSFGFAALIPWLFAVLIAFIDTVRTAMLMPTIVYFATCYLRGYQFRRRHIIAVVFGLLFFFYFTGPLAVFTRSYIADQPFRERAYYAFHILATHHDPAELQSAAEQGARSDEAAEREQYYSRPGTFMLSRLSLIRLDSAVISTCSNGIHYGLAAVKIDLMRSIPALLYKNKPQFINGGDYVGRITGMASEGNGVSNPTISAVSDSYGSFGWTSVILVPLICFPITFVVYESIFDINKLWGTVALGASLATFGEISMSRLFPFMLRAPLVLVLLSYLLGGIIKIIPTKGDQTHESTIGIIPLAGGGSSCSTDEVAEQPMSSA